MANTAMELLMNRQSLRVYDGREVPEDVKRAVLEAAVRAPTAGALMLYAMIEVDDPALKARLAETCDHQPFIAKAPWVVIFCADYQRMIDGWAQSGAQPSRKPGVGDLMLAVSDALIAAQNAVVAAEAQGLGSCYIGDIIENAEIHRELLNLPRYAFPAAMLCFGYPPEGFKRNMVPRLPVEQLTHKNRYASRTLEGYALDLCQKSFKKFEADFSVEMTRSVGEWLKPWQ